ncbi:trans-sulfuration enzyme family protein [Spongisporangium articulatum]|uniref:Trans-sulfuration enzyme family protein n=1 Tax=Spongisporangium articulatum TaxID=3362603 RepID=A0ABW8AN22_9ACTN
MTETPGDRPAAPSSLAPATLAVTAGRPAAETGNPVNAPVVLTSTYRARPGAIGTGDDWSMVYGRFDNPTWTALEEALAALEGGGRALAFGSGMAAISAVVDLVPVGGVVVAPRAPYSGTAALLAQLHTSGRVRHREVPIADTSAVLAALAPAASADDPAPADLLLLESPTNPLLEVAELPALIEAAHEVGCRVAVDNTFATPLLQRPLDLGADVSLHSATKYLGGHSDVLLGAAVVRDDALYEKLYGQRTLGGALAGPWEAWLVLRGLRTLALRVERAGANAAELARRLQGHDAVERVRHPSLPDDPGHARASAQMSGYGAIVSVEVYGGAEAAERVCAETRLWMHATSLGGVESSLERRRRYPAESPAVPDALIRLSVGVEDVEDLWADLSQALDHSRG